jgi:hypothetical protein
MTLQWHKLVKQRTKRTRVQIVKKIVFGLELSEGVRASFRTRSWRTRTNGFQLVENLGLKCFICFGTHAEGRQRKRRSELAKRGREIVDGQ